MATPTASAPAKPGSRAALRRPYENGQPDPRAVTGYTVTLATVGGNSVVTILLDQPCVVRSPHWAFIDATDGSRIYAPTMAVVDNRTFFFQFAGVMANSIGFIEVPYQDMQVQNFQGGFVQPGARWFRKPT
jgi:hypothetical protein